jgi:hypothetical protein
MANYPKQEIPRRATVARRDRVTVRRESTPGGASNPIYSQLIAELVPAEVLQVSGGEVIRGKQVEGNTTFVISVGWLPEIKLDARCEITIESGVYRGSKIYTHRVHYETDRSRPVGVQLHGRARD